MLEGSGMDATSMSLFLSFIFVLVFGAERFEFQGFPCRERFPRSGDDTPKMALFPGLGILIIEDIWTFFENQPAGICFLREAPERAIGSDRRQGKWGLVLG
jgi:hypothetical protein